MPGQRYKQAVNALSRLPTATNRLSTSDFEQSDAAANERTLVATHKFNRPVVIKSGATLDVDLVAYESIVTDATAGNQETVSLSHDILDSDSNPQNIVVYEAGSKLAVDSVDYANNTVTVTPANADATLHIFYVAADQATLEVRKTAPNGVHETLAEYDVGLINQRNQNKKPLEFEADHRLQGVIPTDWTLDFYVDAPYAVSWGVDTDNDGVDEAEPTNQLVSVPIRRSEQDIPNGIKDVVAQVAATQ